VESEDREDLLEELGEALGSDYGPWQVAGGEYKAAGVIAEFLKADGYEVRYGIEDDPEGPHVIAQCASHRWRPELEVELNFGTWPVTEASITSTLAGRSIRGRKKTIYCSRGGYTPGAVSLAERSGLVEFEFISASRLIEWVKSLGQSIARPTSAAFRIIWDAVEELVLAVARDSSELENVEWRDFERMMAAAIGGLGFDVELTRGSGDGGRDIVVRGQEGGQSETYLLELKHWTTRRPGTADVMKLASVVASEGAQGGLFLSTSGVHLRPEALARTCPRIGIGGAEKVESLCQLFHRRRNGLWTPGPLNQVLFAEPLLWSARDDG